MTADHHLRQVLVVDDVPASELLVRTLAASGFLITHADSVEHALFELSRAYYHAALVELHLDHAHPHAAQGTKNSGQSVLGRAMELPDPPVVLMMSARTDVTTVVSAIRSGAADFLEKPIDGTELLARLELALLKAIQHRKLKIYEESERRSIVAPRPTLPNNAMRETLALVDKVAATPSSGALLIGESGSGKEVIAARIHDRSSRSAGPFVRVNVAAIPSSMFEAELFGSVKGAFTDAKANRAGHMASADGGTILLDEIGELRLEDQPKLLRALEERRFFPIGSDHQRTVNVRVIAATNRDPRVMLDEGRLRPDLFYRLGTVINVPPLRERPDEIVALVEHFVPAFCLDFGRAICRLSPEAMTLLQGYSWPGNVRQLRNALERAIMLTDGELIPAEAFDLVALSSTTSASTSASTTSASAASAAAASTTPPPVSGRTAALHRLRRESASVLERDLIVKALEAGHSRAAAARLLGVSRSTLYERLKRYKLQ